MVRILLCIILAVVLMSVTAVDFAGGLVTNPIKTFNSIPIWFWPIGLFVMWGSFYTSFYGDNNE